jgi:hypothetical protein
MFYLLKYLLFPYLVILKQCCNNIFYFNLVFICFICVFAHSRFVKNPPIDLEEMNSSFPGWICHTNPLNEVRKGLNGGNDLGEAIESDR